MSAHLKDGMYEVGELRQHRLEVDVQFTWLVKKVQQVPEPPLPNALDIGRLLDCYKGQVGSITI